MVSLVKYLVRVNMLRMLLFLHHIAFAPYTLHLLILAHIYAYTGRSCRAENGNSSGASLRGYSEVHKCQVARILT
jgi:hypothetical protein